MADSSFSDPTARQIASYLDGVGFPCAREDLVHTARLNHADPEFVAAVEELPEQRFDSLEQVIKSLVRV